MATYILCPECGEDLGCLDNAIRELKLKHNELCLSKNDQIDPSCVEMKPDIIKNIDYILDGIGLTNLCCRMRVISFVDFDNIYKMY